jgi:DNA-directed RNA polymerase specialized sigma24 family protein
MKANMEGPDASDFESFFEAIEPYLRRAHFAVFGLERGPEATAEALAWAWETWPRARDLDSPIGYLFRVGQSKTRRRRFKAVFTPDVADDPLVEPKLGAALAQLSESQRAAVVLVHGFGWTLREVAQLRGVKVTSVQTHLERGLRRLRTALEVTAHA